MKKIWIFAVIAILCSCASTGNSREVNLDSAIQLAGRDINDSLTAGTKVALLNFTSQSDVLSDYVIEEMSITLVKGKKVVVVDRKEIDLIRSEMDFQMSGEVSDESAQEIGKKLGAQSIVSGSLVSMGETHRFRTKVINVNSAAIETSSSVSVVDDPQLQYLLAQSKSAPAPRAAEVQNNAAPVVTAVPAQAVVPEPAPAVSPEPAVPAAPVAPPAPTAYKLGDTGPAGGLIFYDKGNNSNGWRYLEAAPVEAEFQAVWSVHGTYVENNLQASIGNGKRNTELIVEKFRQTAGEWDTAAQTADDLVFNKFDDWFLPSQAELDQMYGNLKRKNLGDFKEEWYWCSTEGGGFASYAYRQDFTAGKIDSDSKKYKLNVRPIRQVPGAN